MGELLIERVKSIHEYYKSILPGEIETVFVSEYMNQNGERTYEDLWLFHSDLICEAKSFIHKDDFDVAKLAPLLYARTIKSEYDGKTATEKSSMSVEFNLENAVHGQIKASKQNCEELMKLLTKRILKWMK